MCSTSLCKYLCECMQTFFLKELLTFPSRVQSLLLLSVLAMLPHKNLNTNAIYLAKLFDQFLL